MRVVRLRASQRHPNCIPSYVRGINLRYDDLRNAVEGKDVLEQHGFTVEYITGYSFALAKSPSHAMSTERQKRQPPRP